MHAVSDYLRRVMRSPTALVLLGVNLIPLAGVLLAYWSFFDLVILYWLETGVICIFDLAKIPIVYALRQTSFDPKKGAWEKTAYVIARAGNAIGGLATAVAIAFAYGIMLLMYGGLILTFMGRAGELPMNEEGGLEIDARAYALERLTGDLAGPLLGFVASHGFSFVYNFVGRREYAKVKGKDLPLAAMGRVVIMHLVFWFSGMCCIHVLPLAVLLKIAADLWSHLKEHETGVIRLLPAGDKKAKEGAN